MTPLRTQSVTLSEPYASTRLSPEGWLGADLPAVGQDTRATQSRELRSLMTEVHMSRPYAALGGSFSPGGERLTIRVGTTGVPDLTANPPLEGLRNPGSLLVGIPYDLARGALAGLLDVAASIDFAAGELIVDSAAYDPIESSMMSFKVAGGLLFWGLMQDPTQLTRERLVSAWEKWSGSGFAWI